MNYFPFWKFINSIAGFSKMRMQHMQQINIQMLSEFLVVALFLKNCVFQYPWICYHQISVFLDF